MKFFADLLIGGKVLSYEVGARDFPEASSVVFAFLAGVSFINIEGEVLHLSAKPVRGRKYLILGEREFKS